MCQSKFLNTLFQKGRGKQSNKTRRNFWKRFMKMGKGKLRKENTYRKEQESKQKTKMYN